MTDEYTPIYAIFMPSTDGQRTDFIFFKDDPELTNNAEVLVPFEHYGITIYLMNKFNHEPAIFEMMAFKQNASKIVQFWSKWQHETPGESLFCLLCNKHISPATIEAQTFDQSIAGERGLWVDIQYTCPECHNTMQYSRQWDPPMDDDLLTLVLAGEEDYHGD